MSNPNVTPEASVGQDIHGSGPDEVLQTQEPLGKTTGQNDPNPVEVLTMPVILMFDDNTQSYQQELGTEHGSGGDQTHKTPETHDGDPSKTSTMPVIDASKPSTSYDKKDLNEGDDTTAPSENDSDQDCNKVDIDNVSIITEY